MASVVVVRRLKRHSIHSMLVMGLIKSADVSLVSHATHPWVFMGRVFPEMSKAQSEISINFPEVSFPEFSIDFSPRPIIGAAGEVIGVAGEVIGVAGGAVGYT